jgi:hypothetical protein
MAHIVAVALAGLPPWTVLAGIVGMANAALFFLIAGRPLLRLPLYLVCGGAVAALVQPLSTLLGDSGGWLLVGEVSLPLVALAAWLAVGVARLLGL